MKVSSGWSSPEWRDYGTHSRAPSGGANIPGAVLRRAEVEEEWTGKERKRGRTELTRRTGDSRKEDAEE